MTQYNDATLTYDDIGLLYNGIELGPNATLVIDGNDFTEVLADRSLRVRKGSHGNSLGTLDATLINPLDLGVVLPYVEKEVRLYVANDLLYDGTVRSLETHEYDDVDRTMWFKFSAQDSGPDEGALPTAASVGISDNPDGVTTVGFESLRRMIRTTEGGSPVVSIEVKVRGPYGFKENQNVELTHDQITAGVPIEFNIAELSVEWPTAGDPLYTLTLGLARLSLANVVREVEVVDDSITATKISDGAVTTPKLAANAVIANVANVGGTVVIDSTGIEVTDGSITVENGSGTVIIDGTSNMFKIMALGSLSGVSSSYAPNATFATWGYSAYYNTAIDYEPAFICFMRKTSDGTTRSDHTVHNNSGEIVYAFSTYVEADTVNDWTYIGYHITRKWVVDSDDDLDTFKFYILKEAAI